MFIEKRQTKKSIKYYLVHSFRDEDNKVTKLRHYLGSNLNDKELKEKKKKAEIILKERIESIKTQVFDFSLSDKEIDSLNRYSDKIKIHHFEDKEWENFTEEFIYNTNAIEGSTVLKDEVHVILQKKSTDNPDEIETKGVQKAINFIRDTDEDLTLKLILKIHKLCFEGSKDYAGQLRDVEVVIRNRNKEIIHRGASVKDLKKELKEFIDWYKKNKHKFKPLTLAAIVHNQFEDIHPFQDGNGRVGRLLLNFILMKNDYPPINILLKDRAEYYRVLQEYQQNDRLRPTLEFLVKQYRKTLKQVTTKKT